MKTRRLNLLARTTLRYDDAIPRDFDRMHAVVTVTTRGGRTLSKKVDRLSGWIGYPLTRDERLAKFHSCARRILPGSAADRIVELADGLDALENVREIMDIVRT